MSVIKRMTSSKTFHQFSCIAAHTISREVDACVPAETLDLHAAEAATWGLGESTESSSLGFWGWFPFFRPVALRTCVPTSSRPATL